MGANSWRKVPGAKDRRDIPRRGERRGGVDTPKGIETGMGGMRIAGGESSRGEGGKNLRKAGMQRGCKSGENLISRDKSLNVPRSPAGRREPRHLTE